MLSLSSANWSASASRGLGPSGTWLLWWEVRKEEREDGRSGVIGRDAGERERAREDDALWNGAA